MKGQIELFVGPEPRPLRRILTPERLRAVPRLPGVYWFVGVRPGRPGLQVLYVGKAVNLRRRLAGYRVAPPGRLPPALARHLTHVQEVRWQPCPSHAEAVRYEAELLQLYHPPGNRQGTHPHSRWFAGMLAQGRDLLLTRADKPLSGGEWFGAFTQRATFGILSRCLWRVWSASPKIPDWPLGWWEGSGPRLVRFHFSEDRGGERERDHWTDRLRKYWLGQSDELLTWLRQEAVAWAERGAWKRWGFEADLAQLERFFTRQARALGALRLACGTTKGWLAAEQVERALALSRLLPRHGPHPSPKPRVLPIRTDSDSAAGQESSAEGPGDPQRKQRHDRRT
ncbi:nucleotide excision repair endonuclease [Limisphaera sp. VF-2]|uniref:nucleotide excision repair endonuclease n=1 Tax=Limisphaera sp. VF-2 TaxID=3400418 RepID=UPI003C19322E